MPTSNIFTRLWIAFRNSLPKEPEPDPYQPVTIAKVLPIMRPYVDLLRSRLEADGITCMINGDWHTHAAFVRLQVMPADADHARALLKELEDS